MMDKVPTGFRLPRLCLPRPGTDLAKWAVIACDQYTSEPEYWQRVEQEVGDAPSTLHLIFPEAHLESADAPARIARIQAAMQRYLGEGLFVEHEGTILVERTVDGRTRRGLMLELDLEHYDFSAGSTSLIRPTEGTIVARLAPRIEVRRSAALELPHILVLIDDPEDSVIGPVAAAAAAARDARAPLYETELMQGGGHVVGHAVDAALGQRAAAALAALARPEVFAPRYGVPADTPPMLFAMGDGNHSLATAKSIWQQVRGTVGLDHPSRYALVEVENVHDRGLHFAPIHRLLFGVRGDWRAALAEAFGKHVRVAETPSAAAMRERVSVAGSGGSTQVVGLIEPGGRCAVIEIDNPPTTLAMSTLQPVIDRFVERGGATQLDYVHGDEALLRLAQQPGCTGLHFAGLDRHELLKRVVHEGPLPRKTFSMGEAHEKRFYVEARRIR